MAKTTEREGNPFVYYVPRQILDPLTIFSYWTAHMRGEVPNPSDIRVVPISLRGNPTITESYMVSPIFTHRGRDQIIEQIATLPQNWTLTRLGNYLSFCLPNQQLGPLQTLERMNASPLVFALMSISSMRHWEDPHLALMAGMQLINRIIDQKVDPIRAGELGNENQHSLEELRDISSSTQTKIEGKVAQMITRAETGEDDFIKIKLIDQELVLRRTIGRASILEGHKVSVAVIGPANSGKSTMVANLEFAMSEVIKSITNVPNFWSLTLPCRAIEFDAATPDLQRIIKGVSASLPSNEKVVWTSSIAMGLVQKFLTADNGISVVSTPGGRPDRITDTLTLPLDAAILLIAANDQADWDMKFKLWTNVLRQNGVTPLALVRRRDVGEISRTTGKPVEASAITNITSVKRGYFHKLDWVNQVRGRLVGPRRKIEDGDTFYHALAQLLIYDLLPGLIIDRYLKSLKYTKIIFK